MTSLRGVSAALVIQGAAAQTALAGTGKPWNAGWEPAALAGALLLAAVLLAAAARRAARKKRQGEEQKIQPAQSRPGGDASNEAPAGAGGPDRAGMKEGKDVEPREDFESGREEACFRECTEAFRAYAEGLGLSGAGAAEGCLEIAASGRRHAEGRLSSSPPEGTENMDSTAYIAWLVSVSVLAGIAGAEILRRPEDAKEWQENEAACTMPRMRQILEPLGMTMQAFFDGLHAAFFGVFSKHAPQAGGHDGILHLVSAGMRAAYQLGAGLSMSRPAGKASPEEPAGAKEPEGAAGGAGAGAAEALRLLKVPCSRCGGTEFSSPGTPDGAVCRSCGLEFDGRQALLSFLGMPAPGQGFRMACLDLFLKQARKDGVTDKDVPIFVPELAVLGAAAVRTLMRDAFVSVSGMTRIMLLLDAALGAGAAAAVMWHADFSRLSSGGAGAVLAEAESEDEKEAFESVFQQAGTSRELFHPGLFRWFTPLLLAHGTLGLSAPEAFSDGLRAAFLLGVHIRLERFGFR